MSDLNGSAYTQNRNATITPHPQYKRQFLEVRPQGKLPNPTKKKRKRNGWPNNRSGGK